MKSVISIIGTILIILGIIGFSYNYFSYTSNEKVAEVGSVKVTAEKNHVIEIPPVASFLLLGSGIILVIVGLSRKI